MKILVTGANGYLGQGIVKKLLDDGNAVVGTDLTTDLVDPRADAISCNLFEIEDPYHYFGCPDVLLHLAWRDGFVHNSPNHMGDLPKHCDFLQRMVNSGIGQVAVMGTMHEIGFYEGSIDEHTPCNPMNFYGVAKDALRKYTALIAKADGAVFQWLRGYYIVGNSQYGNSIFSKITAAANSGKAEFPFTTGQNQYDFLDYTDFCFQVTAAILQKDVDGIINICSGRPETLGSRVERFIRENGYSISLRYGAIPDRPYDSKAVWGNDRKIRMILDHKGEK